MDLNSYFNEIKKSPAVLYLATGSELVLYDDLRRGTRKIADAQHAEFLTFDLAEDSVDQFLVSLDNSSLFSSKRYIYLEHFFSAFKKQFTSTQANFFQSQLEGALPEVTLIFNGFGETIDRRTTINKLITRHAVSVQLDQIKPNEVRANLIHYFKSKHGIEVKREVIEEILNRTNNDYTALRAEIPKLDLFFSTSSDISIEEVKELISFNPDDNIFGLIGALSSKKFKDVMVIYRDLLDYYGQPYLLNASLLSNFQLILQVKILNESGYDQSQMQRKLGGIHPYRIKLSLQNSNRFSMAQLIRLNHLLLVFDQKIKTTTVDYDELFNDLILELKIGR